MYEVQHSGSLARLRQRLAREGRPAVGRTVVLLGLTSLLTDISSEMVAAILPIYLVAIRGLDPVQFGVIDGIYQGGSALVRMVFGFVADRMRRYRDVAAVGYGLSAATKAGLIAAGGAFGAVSAMVLVDRTGKGIRTAPRDALISLSAPPESLGLAFGVHRAMDTCGAMIGPVIAFGLLALDPGAYNGLFLVSFCFALLGLAVLLLLVREPALDEGAGGAAHSPAHDDAAIGGVDVPAHDDATDVPHSAAAPARVAPRATVAEAARLTTTRRFGGLVGVAALLGLVTISDAFVYLELERQIDFDASIFPLLYVGTALVFMVLAVPVGRLADRIGRPRVFLGGYGFLLALYLTLQLAPSGIALLPLSLIALGLFYAATDGVLPAIGSMLVPEHLRGTGLAVLGTATGLARFTASVSFGALWSVAGVETALLAFTIALVVALPAAALLMRSAHEVAA